MSDNLRKGDLYIILLPLILLFLVIEITPYEGTPEERIIYYFRLNSDGFEEIQIIYETSKEEGIMWIVVPDTERYTNWTIKISNGRIYQEELRDAEIEGVKMYFYDNLSFHFRGPLKLGINWTTRLGALVVEPNALFISPAIMFRETDTSICEIWKPENFKKLKMMVGSSGNIRYSEGDDRIVVEPLYGNDRIYMFYSVKGKENLTYHKDGPIILRIPYRYFKEGEKILECYKMAIPQLEELTDAEIKEVKVSFFAPKNWDELPVGGFVPVNPHLKVGEINLNLFYFRWVRGYIESIAIHELTHHYLVELGISTELLWAHEGLANYLSINLAEYLNLSEKAVNLEEDLLEASDLVPPESYNFLISWRTYYTDPRYPTFVHYGVAYRIFYEICEENTEEGDMFPGSHYLHRVFSDIKELGGVKTTEDLVSILILESNNRKEIREKFKVWGFPYQENIKITMTERMRKEIREKTSPLWREILERRLMENSELWEKYVYEVRILVEGIDRLSSLMVLTTLFIVVASISRRLEKW
ncbi:hypothetical protein B6U74_00570 [Candidatus Bathyarchaeota archaeon ex4484_205]|nr:MAG: hypothetical protein B6U74_00570 [Candidatus Bathyarchaeota archaeon ex4484_205]